MRGKRQGEGKRPPRIASVTLGAMLRMPPQVTGMARLASWLLGSWITFASYDKPFLGGSRMQVQPTYLLPTLLLCNRQPPTANRATSMSRRKVRGQNDSASRTKPWAQWPTGRQPLHTALHRSFRGGKPIKKIKIGSAAENDTTSPVGIRGN
ncbi:MAG: hypothetical protein FRX48_05653 [Lasallia pustulata]|uniref:Uncharacterized protein n=1 Tax=Lasallia pustulata TaxID=136370 RepID=A0A5M8PP03_9LECA|nr:MAG: hypothetical protein FRX48_05653 [Lasallia pustulata]